MTRHTKELVEIKTITVKLQIAHFENVRDVITRLFNACQQFDLDLFLHVPTFSRKLKTARAFQLKLRSYVTSIL